MPLTAGTASQTSHSDRTADLTCTAASGGTSPYTYQWYRGTSPGFTPGSGNLLSGKTALILADTGLDPKTDYYYVLRVTDNVAATNNSNEVHVTTDDPLPRWKFIRRGPKQKDTFIRNIC